MLKISSYHVPKHIQEHVDYITPGVKLFSAEKQRNKKRSFGVGHYGKGFTEPLKSTFGVFPPPTLGNVTDCDKRITPDCIRALYRVPKTPEYPLWAAGPMPRNDNSLGVFEEGDFYAQLDLDLFFGNYSTNIPKGTHPTPAYIDGADAPTTNISDAGGESDLDFQLIYPLIYPQTITLYQTDDLYYATNSSSTSSGGFNTFLDALDGSYCTYSAYGETGNSVVDPVYPNTLDPNGYKGKLMCGVYKVSSYQDVFWSQV